MIQEFNWKDIAEISGTVVLAATLLFSYRTYSKQSQIQHYHAIDEFYFNILRLTIEFPYLRSQAFIDQWGSGSLDLTKPESVQKAAAYDSYAFIVWNFIETIYDRCGDPIVSKTWEPIFRQDGKLHLAWFLVPKNRENFKGEFVAEVSRKLGVAFSIQNTDIKRHTTL